MCDPQYETCTPESTENQTLASSSWLYSNYLSLGWSIVPILDFASGFYTHKTWNDVDLANNRWRNASIFQMVEGSSIIAWAVGEFSGITMGEKIFYYLSIAHVLSESL